MLAVTNLGGELILVEHATRFCGSNFACYDGGSGGIEENVASRS